MLTALDNDILDRAHQRIVVFEPTVMSLKNTLRFLSVSQGPNQVLRPLLVLNKAGQPGGLSEQQVEMALGMAPDVVLPYMPKLINSAANLGELPASKSTSYRHGIAQIAHEVGAVALGHQSLQKRLSNFIETIRERFK